METYNPTMSATELAADGRQQGLTVNRNYVKSYLELSEGVGVVSQTQGVEGATGVQGVQALKAGALTSCTVCLSTAHEDDLCHTTML